MTPVELIRSYKRELDANLRAIQTLQQELRRRGIDLTECRLLDLFLWAYSGTYTPLFRRGEAGASHGSVTASIPEADTQSAERLDVETSCDDDNGYLAWLVANPVGFVLT